MNSFSKNWTGIFRKSTAAIQIIKICVFLLVGVCRQISRSFPCNVDVIGGNSQYLLIRFFDFDHSFQNKAPRFFCTNVSIKTFVFVENLSKWQSMAKFFASEPFLPQKVQQLQRSLNCLKGRRFFSPKQLAASICYAFFSLYKPT